MFRSIWNFFIGTGLPVINLNTQEGYEIASAIRGPDGTYGGSLKILTVKVRRLAGCKSNKVGGAVESMETQDYEATALIRVIGEDHFGHIHFLQHVYDAAEALGASGLKDAAKMLMNARTIPIDSAVLLEALNRESP